jgi:hypothetical protein
VSVDSASLLKDGKCIEEMVCKSGICFHANLSPANWPKLSVREENSNLVIFLIVYSSQQLLKMYKQRPIGVTIIALLAILGGIAFLVSGLGTLILIPLIGIFIGSGLFILGLAYFLMAYGLWKGKGWAWILTLILSGIGIIVGIGSILVGNPGSVFHTIINAIVIYYLYRPNVKAFFNK